ncbi:MAG: hypothetical protein IKO85_02825 [Bacteroidaceae bacterium]|nr:hypothetical protein [Bacteroidaceae bacterium]
MKKILAVILSVVSLTTVGAQDKVEATLGVDLVKQYIWRGQDLGDVSLQPTLGISWKGLSLSTWGSVGISDFSDDKELDFTLDYTYKGFSVGITDYWFSTGSYFQYKNDKTTHIWEAGIGYDFGFLSLQWYTNFAGNDGLNNDSKRAYSSYFELSAPFRLGGLDWTATMGVVPWATTSYNANGFCVTNVSLRATKDFVIKDKYHLPVFAGLTANPRNEKLYLLFGVSFNL